MSIYEQTIREHTLAEALQDRCMAIIEQSDLNEMCERLGCQPWALDHLRSVEWSLPIAFRIAETLGLTDIDKLLASVDCGVGMVTVVYEADR